MLKTEIKILFLLTFATSSIAVPQSSNSSNIRSEKLTVYQDNDKSSLVFVFDTTGSMYNDLRQLKEGAEMILDTALEENGVIEDFVFVPFHDPAVGPATVTRNKEVFKSALNIVRVYGGGDCPEKSLGGIQLALNVSRPRSYVYVFTDATASDHRLVGKVLDLVQRRQSQVVFVLTGHCNDLHKPHYKVYQQIAAASAGQVFNLNKTSVHKVLDFVRSSIRARTVNLGSVVNPPGYNYTQEIPIDKSLSEVTVSVSGAKPSIKVVDPSGQELSGPPRLITTLDLSEIMVVKVLQPEPGNWTITTGSEEDYSVKVVGRSNLTFNHGFSVERPNTMADTSYRPLQGTYNHMLISLTQIDRPVNISYAEILSLDGKTLFEIPLHEVDAQRKIYLADAFVPPDDFFYIAINGHDEYNQELRRIGATAVQAKPPDVPYLTVTRRVEVRAHERVVLTCNIESLVPLTAMWTKDNVKVQPQISSLQSTSLEYVIEDMSEDKVGTYRCVAKNVAGVAQAVTEITMLVDAPQVTITPNKKTVQIGDSVTISCTVLSDALLLKYQLVFNGTQNQYATDINLEPNIEGVYVFNKSITNISEQDGGVYSCVAVNRGGQNMQSTEITVLTTPTVQILGPHSLVKPRHSDIQLVCSVDNANRVVWLAPNGTSVKEVAVAGSYTDMLDIKDVDEEGEWKCKAIRGLYEASDAVKINILIKPEVLIEGAKNITIINGTTIDIVCNIEAKPTPRILWHRETETFLNNTITQMEPNKYKSVLTLDSAKENVKGSYFCFGENSEGIHQDSVTVDVRRKMKLVEGFTDMTEQLYSQISLPCRVDSYPAPHIRWYHNDTHLTMMNDNVYLTENNDTLYILKLDFENLGTYRCNADNGYEKLEVQGSLNVDGLESPVLFKEPVRRVTQKGKSTILTCRVIKGNPEPSLSWQFRSDGSDHFTALPRDVIMNENRSEVILANVESYHWGVYRCVAENIVGRDEYDALLVVQYPPEIKREANNTNQPLEVQAGKKVTFSCEAAGVPPPIVTWTKNNRPISYSRNIYLTNTSELVIEKATEYDSGVFTCKAASVLGSTRKNFTLVVYVPPVIAQPEIEPQLEVVEGSLVELPCTGRGVPRPQIEWLQNGEVIREDRKYIDEFGLRFVANLTDFGDYTCTAKNPYGNASFSYSVYVWVAPYIEPPLRNKQNVLLGANTTLGCDAVGFPIPGIFWEFQGQILTENTTDFSFNDYGVLNITKVSSRHEGMYDCIAQNVAGFAKKSIYLSVTEPPRILADNFNGPYIATDRDTELILTCKAAGNPKPFVIWAKDNHYLDKDSRYNVDADGTLIIKSPSEELSGLYTCVAKNIVGSVNKTVSVEIYSLPVMQAEQSDRSMTAVEGTNATIECPVPSTSMDKVKWYKDAKLISTGQLLIPNITRDNASTYACVVSNTVVSSYSTVQVVVEWGPRFVGSGGDVEAVRGDDWYFGCEVDANPVAKTKWLFNSKPILGQDKEKLKLMNIQLRNTGVYKCIVSNPHGTVTRQFALDVLVAPFISEFDVLDVQLKEGTNATLECNAKGLPTPNISWIFNNTNWHVQNSSLTTSNITEQSEGVYRCNAVNKAGAAYIVYRVTVATTALVQEVTLYRETGGETVEGKMEVTLGSRVRLSCKASGKPSPTIQWIRNGNVISQNDDDIAYADLILDRVETSHSGTYSCIVSNDGGMDERDIKLDVLEPPKIFQSLFQNGNSTEDVTRLEVISGQAFFLHCHPYGNPMPEIYWFKNDVPLRLFDDSMVSRDYGEVIQSNGARVEHSGKYTCVARNRVGDATAVYLVDVLVPPPTTKESSKPISSRLGVPLSLTCPVEGSPLPNVMWVKHPYVEVSAETPKVELSDDNITLIINSTEVSDSGQYSCIMTNKVGTTEVVFDVTIEKPPSIAGNVGDNILENHVVPLRRSVVLKCQVDGHPMPRINWLKDTQQLSDNLSNIQRVLGNSLLTIWSVNVRDAGQYICIAENTAGTAYRRYNVIVQVPGKWSGWSQWSFCNATCGLGYQQRSRMCHYMDDYNVTYDKNTKSDKVKLDESACKGLSYDRRKCHMPPCEEDETQQRWSMWSRWSQCSATCGVGTQARTRRCKSRAKCVGDNVQIRKCPSLPKCDNKSDQTSSENEVFNSKEEQTTETNPYVPEATFEMRPETVHTATDVEEIYIKPEPNYSTVYYEVNVTENLDRSYRGPCDPGYTHDNATQACNDIDECLIANNLCHSTQACMNTAGAYRCACPKGFTALGVGQRCLDINECEQDIHGCEFACVNTAGGYVCACPRHLRLHTDKHQCVRPSSQYRQYSNEELDSEDNLSIAIDFPAKYMKTRN